MENDLNKKYKEYCRRAFGIDADVMEKVDRTEREMTEAFTKIDADAALHQMHVLKAFHDANVSDSQFGWNTGYGYDDRGREVTEDVFAYVSGAEAALVRTQMVNGTHAIAIAMLGLLNKGDELLYVTGTPYDTMQAVIGITGSSPGSLKEYGIGYRQVELLPDGAPDIEGILYALTPQTRMVAIQRSTGYGWRPTVLPYQIREIAEAVHQKRSDVIVLVDNSYCEFVGSAEPICASADVAAGSLIKNPGGGLALSGGYVCGKKELTERIAYRLTCPGIGGECGLTFGQTRPILEGLFQAPRVVADALKGAVLAGSLFASLGFPVSPAPGAVRGDIVQAIRLGNPAAVAAFAAAVQEASPVDHRVLPVAGDMPGYADPVIMAAGTFVQGSSIELSADAPVRAPYNIYLQGGLTYAHARFGITKALDALYKGGFSSL